MYIYHTGNNIYPPEHCSVPQCVKLVFNEVNIIMLVLECTREERSWNDVTWKPCVFNVQSIYIHYLTTGHSEYVQTD